MVVIAGFVPVVEELMFRGLGFTLLRRFGATAAIVLVGIAFALVHGIAEGLPVFAFFGMGLAFLRYPDDERLPVHRRARRVQRDFAHAGRCRLTDTVPTLRSVLRFLVPAVSSLRCPHTRRSPRPRPSACRRRLHSARRRSTTTLTATGDAASYRWELPGDTRADGASVTHDVSRRALDRRARRRLGDRRGGSHDRHDHLGRAHGQRAARSSTIATRAYLTGRVVPALPGSRLVVQRDGRPAGWGLVRAAGRFRIGIRPRVPGSYTVSFGGATSNAAPVTVRPEVALSVAGRRSSEDGW